MPSAPIGVMPGYIPPPGVIVPQLNAPIAPSTIAQPTIVAPTLNQPIPPPSIVTPTLAIPAHSNPSHEAMKRAQEAQLKQQEELQKKLLDQNEPQTLQQQVNNLICF